MKTIWKFPFAIEDKQTVRMPAGARIIHTGPDPQGTPCLWAEVDPKHPMQERTIYVRGTGHPLAFEETNIGHVGSFVQGPFVWHVYTLTQTIFPA